MTRTIGEQGSRTMGYALLMSAAVGRRCARRSSVSRRIELTEVTAAEYDGHRVAKRSAGVISSTRKIGQFEISTDGDVVNLWVSAEFDLEVALEYAAAMEQTIDRMPSVFGVMTRFERPPIIGPDVEASLKQTAKHRTQCGTGGRVVCDSRSRPHRHFDCRCPVASNLRPH